jgi:hypothetical protein
LLSIRNISIRTAWLGTALALVGAAPASAADPNVYEAPVVSGTAQVGKTLTASGGRWTGPSGTVSGRAWQRCDSNGNHCAYISGAMSSTYTLVDADRGKRMRTVLYAWRWNDWDWMASSATAVVAAAPVATPAPTPAAKPPVPTPTPTKTPAPTPTATPTPAPPAQPTPVSQVTVTAPPESSFTSTAPTVPDTTLSAPTKKAKKARMIKPFPTVRLSGRLTRAGADIRLFTVRAPRGVRITVSCSGRGCPLREVALATTRGARALHIPQYERTLRAGTRLTVTVTKPGYIAKVTRITIRRAKAPARSDQCRSPGQSRLTRCPR